MMPDPRKYYRSLIHLCRVAHAGADTQAFFRKAAAEIHELTGCDRVSLMLPSGGSREGRGMGVEFAEPPRWFEIPEQTLRESATGWVLEHRQARAASHRETANLFPAERQLFTQGYRTCIAMPLLCRGEIVGVLGLANRQENVPEEWDQQILDDLCGLFALMLDDLAAHQRVAELQRFQSETAYLRDEIKADRDLRLLTGESPAMKAVRLAIQQVARTDSTALILGETGTGKELIARAIHQLSPRRARLLVAVNCAALAPGIIASELFGHEQGAFTGATKRRHGRFELAQGGTIFLDEIGELPPEIQVTLLRVLQERAIERVGGQESIPVNVRIIAATHQDLTAAMNQRRFRADLFFRLNVFPIRVPPLRERREDIPDLVRHFLHHFGRRMNRPVSGVNPASLKLLTEYHWPGNVRELENIVERAMIVTTGATLEVDPHWLRPVAVGGTVAAAPPGLAEVERCSILDALERCKGKIYGPDGAAAVLGLKPTTLYGKMRKHGIARRPGPK